MSTENPLKPAGALMPVEDAATSLGISVKRMKAAVASRQIPLYAMQIGGKTYVRRADLDRFTRGKPELDHFAE